MSGQQKLMLYKKPKFTWKSGRKFALHTIELQFHDRKQTF